MRKRPPNGFGEPPVPKRHGVADIFIEQLEEFQDLRPLAEWAQHSTGRLEFPEVMVERGGFDAFVGNPPFMGGQKITGNLGDEYREYLVESLGARSARKCRPLCLLLSSCSSNYCAIKGRWAFGHQHHCPGRYP